MTGHLKTRKSLNVSKRCPQERSNLTKKAGHCRSINFASNKDGPWDIVHLEIAHVRRVDLERASFNTTGDVCQATYRLQIVHPALCGVDKSKVCHVLLIPRCLVRGRWWSLFNQWRKLLLPVPGWCVLGHDGVPNCAWRALLSDRVADDGQKGLTREKKSLSQGCSAQRRR